MGKKERDSEPLGMQLPPKPHPERVFIKVRGKKIPLLPVFVGWHPVEELPDQLVATWALWVHPDWPSDVEFVHAGEEEKAQLLVDVLPSYAMLQLHLEIRDDLLVVPRHLG
jgi:hypothetical protein